MKPYMAMGIVTILVWAFAFLACWFFGAPELFNIVLLIFGAILVLDTTMCDFHRFLNRKRPTKEEDTYDVLKMFIGALHFFPAFFFLIMSFKP